MKVNIDYTETKKIGEKIILISNELEEINNKLKSEIEDIRHVWMEIDSDITINSISNYLNSTLYNTIVGVKNYGNCIIRKSSVYDYVHTDYKIKARKTLVESEGLSKNFGDNSKKFERGNI